tara:strand:- start:1525 stop:1767 length:243 start_codon:yes stop_codon:yes gene_type:complete
MIVAVKLKCNKDHIPYRLYINNDLMTERYYAMPNKNVVSNDFKVNIKEQDSYDIQIENLSDTTVKIVDTKITKEPKDEIA